MDYETKIYLDNLIEAVEKLNNPDWWTIVLTIINIVAFIFVAITQIKLQRQQIKQQEYEVYKKMFSVVEEANDVAKTLLNFIYRYFSRSNAREINENTLIHLQGKIKEIERNLKDSRADFKLKFLQGNYQAECYIAFLEEMRNITQIFIYLESTGDIEFIEDDNDYEVAIDDNDHAKYDITIINALVERIHPDKYKTLIKESLISYSNRKGRIIKLDIAGRIKDNC